MRPHNGGVDHHMLEVRVIRQDLEKILPNALACPAAEAHEGAVPVPELGRQIAPRCARAQNPQHRIDKQAVVLSRPTLVAFLAGNQLLNPLPLLVRQLASNQDRLLPVAILNHIAASDGIPNVNRT